VLPFANLGSEIDNAYLADGLTDELITALSKVPALRVTSRTSSVALRGTTQGAKAIARQLGVRYLLEGSVQRARARVRITVQLIDAANDVSLWGDRYDSTMGEVLAIQERFTHQVATALELHLTAEATQRVAQQTISSVPAYECYLRARYEGWRWNHASIDHSVRLLRQALELNGDNARLYAALGQAYLQYREAGVDLTERSLLEAERCVAKVFALDPGTAAGRQLRGWIQYSRGQIQDAVHYLKEAVALEPHNTDSLLLLCNCYLISGRVSEARLLASHAQIELVAGATDLFPRFLAQGFALVGMRAPALKWLKVAADRGFINYPFLARHDPSFKALRRDSKFRELLGPIRKRWAKFAV
jgi:TolB-like protein